MPGMNTALPALYRNFPALEAHDSGAREHVVDLGRRVPMQPEPVARPEFGHAASHPGGLGQSLREQGAKAKPPSHRIVPRGLRRIRLVDDERPNGVLVFHRPLLRPPARRRRPRPPLLGLPRQAYKVRRAGPIAAGEVHCLDPLGPARDP